MENQSYHTLDSKEQLISEVDRMKKDGYRLSQACVTKKDSYDVIYSFSRENELVNIRLIVEIGESIESITGIYPYAYLYENEMKDLFGICINNINVDFNGELYHTTIKTPFLGEKKE